MILNLSSNSSIIVCKTIINYNPYSTIWPYCGTKIKELSSVILRLVSLIKLAP
ncbi:hypothetical protein BCN_P218 (plasmid) [Bacillus cereus NC7401]|nr:hypothetical protein BCN_P218 [Bacillus cereus NC7401]